MTKRTAPEVLNCAECGRKFRPTRSTVATCSVECQAIRRREIRRLAAVRRRQDSKHRESERFAAAEYRKNNLEKCRAAGRRHYYENKEQYARRQSEWLSKNAEYASERARAYRERRRDAIRSYTRANSARAVERSRIWRAENPERWNEYSRRRRLARKAASIAPFTAEQLIERLSVFGFKCWICGVDYEAVDHVKPIARGGCHSLANLRPICRSCNSKKNARWPFRAEDIEATE